MRLIDFCLKKPLVVCIFAMAIFIIGFFCMRQMSLTMLPLPEARAIQVNVTYVGASPSTVQNEITSKLVNALQSIEDVDLISANSKAGSSRINISFASLSGLQAIQRLSEINQVVSSTPLPSGANQPVVTRFSGRNGLFDFFIASKTATPLELLDYYNAKLKMPLKKIEGVSLVEVMADIQSSVVRIKVDPRKVAQYNLSLSDIKDTLNSVNQSLPAGSLAITGHNYLINIAAKTDSLPSIANIIIGQARRIIRVKDIASISYEDVNIVPLTRSRLNGQHVIGVELDSTGSSDPIRITQQVKNLLNKARASLPPGMKIIESYNSGELIHNAIMDVFVTILIAAFLVIVICLLFLGRFRNTLIPIVTIPICLSGAFIFLSLFSFSINMFTLLAMVVAIGLVVDDAIVVVEHITIYVEQGMRLDQAVVRGSKEIAVTIIGITLTLVAVYLPTLFMTNVFAIWYQQFTVTLAVCVLLSGLLALTLAPLMCHYLLTADAPNRYQVSFQQKLNRVIAGYHYLLEHVLTYKKTALLLTAMLIAGGIYYCLLIPKSILPKDPTISVLATVHPAPGDTVDTLMIRMQKAFANFRVNDKRIFERYMTASIDPDTGVLTGSFRAFSALPYVKEIPELTEQMNHYIKTKTKLNASAVLHEMFTFGSNGDIALLIQDSNEQRALHAAKKIGTALKGKPQFLSVDVGSPPIQPQYNIKINVAKAYRAGISPADLRSLLSLYLGGGKLSNDVAIGSESVPIYLQLANPYLHDPNVLQLLTIKNNQGKRLPVSDFASLKMQPQATVITTVNNRPSVAININLAKGYSISDGLPLVEQALDHQGPGVMHRYIGLVTEYIKNNKNATMVFLFGILAVYLLLTLLFNSLLDPFIILFTVPFSLIGGALSLYVINGTINIVSIIALITLVGLITKHGVLIVYFANVEQRKGLSILDAIMTASAHRFRPIMMTTLAMAAGSLPLIFATGMGYMMRMQLGVVLCAGLLIGTIFSLFIVPLVYLLLKQIRERNK